MKRLYIKYDNEDAAELTLRPTLFLQLGAALLIALLLIGGIYAGIAFYKMVAMSKSFPYLFGIVFFVAVCLRVLPFLMVFLEYTFGIYKLEITETHLYYEKYLFGFRYDKKKILLTTISAWNGNGIDNYSSLAFKITEEDRIVLTDVSYTQIEEVIAYFIKNRNALVSPD